MGKLILDELAGDPSTPPAGDWVFYPKSGGVFIMDDAGIVTQLANNVRIQEDKTTTYNILAADMNKVLTTVGAVGAVIFNLPDALTVLGQRVTIVKSADFGVTINATSGDVVADSTVDGSISNNTAGETNISITLEAYDPSGGAGAWLIVGAHGTWATA